MASQNIAQITSFAMLFAEKRDYCRLIIRKWIHMDPKLTWILSQLIPRSIYLSIPISSNISSTSASRRSSPVGFLEERRRTTGMRKKNRKNNCGKRLLHQLGSCTR